MSQSKRYFLDCEFIDRGSMINLISIALVADDGREYYACSTDLDLSRLPKWHWENVMQHLPPFDFPKYPNPESAKRECYWKSNDLIAREIQHFTDPGFGEQASNGVLGVLKIPKVEFWAWYGSYDWVVLCSLFGKMIDIPKHFPYFVRDIRWLSEFYGVDRIPVPKPEEQGKAHDALEDARWNREAFEWLDARKGASVTRASS